MPVQRIAITPSVQLAMWLWAVHLGAGITPWLMPFPLWVNLTLTFGLAVSLAYFLRRTAALHAADAAVALEITGNGRISFQTRRGEWQECELLGSSYVSPRLTILNLKPAGARLARHVVLVPDNVNADDFRRLRTWLRWGGEPNTRRQDGALGDV